MQCRKFQITLISAQDLENVRSKFRIKFYAQLSYSGDSGHREKPRWTQRGRPTLHGTSPLDTQISKQAVEYQVIMLVIKLYCSRTLGDRYIGEVSVSFKELFDDAVATGGSATVSYPVKKGAAHSKGVLNFSYSFIDIVIVKKPSVWARSLAVAGPCLGRGIAEVALAEGLDYMDIPFFGEDACSD